MNLGQPTRETIEMGAQRFIFKGKKLCILDCMCCNMMIYDKYSIYGI